MRAAGYDDKEIEAEMYFSSKFFRACAGRDLDIDPFVTIIGEELLLLALDLWSRMPATFCYQIRWNTISLRNRFNCILANTNKPRNDVPFILKRGRSMSGRIGGRRFLGRFSVRGHAMPAAEDAHAVLV